MRIILNADYAGLGEEGDRVEVKDGFARNFLIPRNFAVLDTPAARAYFASKAKAIALRKEEKRKRSLALKERLAGMEVRFVMPAADNGRIFGSVTPNMICEHLVKEGIEIERKRIEVRSKDIKTEGTYSFSVSLYGGEVQSVKLVVEAEKKPVKLTEMETRKPRRPKDEDQQTQADAAKIDDGVPSVDAEAAD